MGGTKEFFFFFLKGVGGGRGGDCCGGETFNQDRHSHVFTAPHPIHLVLF